MKKKLVFLTGAGMSVESGFKTFRGADGLWENYPVQQVATHEGWEADPVLVNNFYNGLRKKLYAAQPNEGHRIVASLQKEFDVTVVTQNVDNLHEKAGSEKVIHLHGELAKVTSSRNREDINCIKEYPLDKPIRIGDKADDGSQLRPYIVWFGEYLNTMSKAIRLVEYADIFVVIGTSLVVYPAAGLVDYAHPEIPKFLIDPSSMEGKLPARFKHIQANAVDGVDILLKELETL
jgi:NAD-dependent deacetylase